MKRFKAKVVVCIADFNNRALICESLELSNEFDFIPIASKNELLEYFELGEKLNPDAVLIDFPNRGDKKVWFAIKRLRLVQPDIPIIALTCKAHDLI